MNIKIGNKIIGKGMPLYFIADIASNHDGDLNRAYRLIELAKEAGADAAKFQNFTAPKIISKYGFEALKGQLAHQKIWTKPVYDTYVDASIPLNWTSRLKEKCDKVEIEYLTSPYDFETIDYVDKYLNAYKIGSGDITWLEIVEYISKKNKPVLLATGASTFDDVRRAYNVLYKFNKKIVLMQCNTNYTANPKNFKYINLNVLKKYSSEFPDVILGLSDHTHGHATILGAVAFGAVVFEKHFTNDNSRPGPDHKFAMNPKTWKEMVQCANELYLALGDGVKQIEENEQDTAVIQRRSLRYIKDFENGHIIEKGDLFPLRPIPADGIPPYLISELVGKKLKHHVIENNCIKWEDIEK